MKRRYIKCMHLYLLPLPICYVWSCSTYTQAQPTALSSIWICNRLCASLWQLDVSIKYFVGQLKMHFFHLDCSTHRLLYACWVQKESLTYLTYMRCSNSVKYLQGEHCCNISTRWFTISRTIRPSLVQHINDIHSNIHKFCDACCKKKIFSSGYMILTFLTSYKHHDCLQLLVIYFQTFRTKNKWQ